jgi:uncharacterized protein CbrC (UPF0167 family)
MNDLLSSCSILCVRSAVLKGLCRQMDWPKRSTSEYVDHIVFDISGSIFIKKYLCVHCVDKKATILFFVRAFFVLA